MVGRSVGRLVRECTEENLVLDRLQLEASEIKNQLAGLEGFVVLASE